MHISIERQTYNARRTTPKAVYKLRDGTTRTVDVSGRYGMN